MKSTYLRFLLIAVFAVALIATACSGNEDEDGDDAADSEPTATVTDDSGDNGEGGENGEEPTAEPTVEPDDGDSGDDGGSGDGANAILQRAQERAGQASQESYRFEMTMNFDGFEDMELDPQESEGFEVDFSEFAMQGSGGIDAANERLHMTFGFSGFEATMPGFEDAFAFEVIQDGDTSYMKNPFLLAFAGGSDEVEWIRTTAESDAAVGVDTSGFDPQSQLAILEAVSEDFEVVGDEEVRGVSTTHYRMVVDAEKASALMEGDLDPETAELVQEFYTEDTPIDLWLDDDGRLYRLQVSYSVPGSDYLPVPSGDGGASDVTMTMVMEAYDYGADISVDIPPDNTVVDGDDLFGGFGDLLTPEAGQ